MERKRKKNVSPRKNIFNNRHMIFLFKRKKKIEKRKETKKYSIMSICTCIFVYRYIVHKKIDTDVNINAC